MSYKGFGGGPEDCFPGQMYFDLIGSCICLPGYVPNPAGQGCVPLAVPAPQQNPPTPQPTVTTDGCFPGQVFDDNSDSCVCMDGFVPSPMGSGCIRGSSLVDTPPNKTPSLFPSSTVAHSTPSLNNGSSVAFLILIGVVAVAGITYLYHFEE